MLVIFFVVLFELSEGAQSHDGDDEEESDQDEEEDYEQDEEETEQVEEEDCEQDWAIALPPSNRRTHE